MAESLSMVDLVKEFGDRLHGLTHKHANDEVRPEGFTRLPPGINGVARLKECYFGKSEKGTFWRAAGVIDAPEFISGPVGLIPVKGLVTTKIVNLRDNSLEEGWTEIMRHIKLLAGEGVFAAASRGEKLDTALLCQLVVKAAPYFRVLTEESEEQWEGGVLKYAKGSRIWERWQGALPGYKPAASRSAGESSNSEVPPAPTSDKGFADGTKKPETHSLVDSYSDSEDLDSLAVRASKDSDVADRLRLMAVKLDYTDDDCDEAQSWEEIVGWIKRGTKKGEGDDNEPAVDVKVGQVVGYCPPDQKDKTGVKRLKECECEVKAVHAVDQTCILQRLDKKNVKYEDVPWAEVVKK